MMAAEHPGVLYDRRTDFPVRRPAALQEDTMVKRPSKTRCIGILTSGGDCPGLNAAIRGITKAAIQVYGMDVVGIRDGC
jgi:hypothetical protein